MLHPDCYLVQHVINMKYMLFLMAASISYADTIIARDESGNVTGPAPTCPMSDPRRIVVADSDHDVMKPYFDFRGSPRWKLQAGQIVYVQPADRAAVDPDRVRQAITDYLTARGWLREATALSWNSTRPALFAKIQAWVDERQQAVTDALRGGQASDDPVTPSKTTITPQ
jgi:hypothetical protein